MGNKQQNLNQDGKLNTWHSPLAFCFSLGGERILQDFSFFLALFSLKSPACFSLRVGFFDHLLLFTPRHCLNSSTPGHFAAPLPSRLRFWRISPATAFPKWTHLSVCHHISSPKTGVSEAHQMLWENQKFSGQISLGKVTYHISFLEHHFCKLRVLESPAVKTPTSLYLTQILQTQ